MRNPAFSVTGWVGLGQRNDHVRGTKNKVFQSKSEVGTISFIRYYVKGSSDNMTAGPNSRCWTDDLHIVGADGAHCPSPAMPEETSKTCYFDISKTCYFDISKKLLWFRYNKYSYSVQRNLAWNTYLSTIVGKSSMICKQDRQVVTKWSIVFFWLKLSDESSYVQKRQKSN